MMATHSAVHQGKPGSADGSSLRLSADAQSKRLLGNRTAGVGSVRVHGANFSYNKRDREESNDRVGEGTDAASTA